MKEAIGITITEAFRKLKVPSKHVGNIMRTSPGDIKIRTPLRDNTHFLG